MKSVERMYVVRMYKEDGGVIKLYMYAPDDESALENAQQGFERTFEFVGVDDKLGMKILEEKIK